MAKSILLLLITTLSLVSVVSPSQAAQKQNFTVAWSVYVGWMPWDYAAKSGILDKWAQRFGIAIELLRINDYVQSIEGFTQGKYDACTMTNMDALTMPAAASVDSTALIVGSFSNGNDGVVLKQAGKTLVDIKNRTVGLVAGSVSHYLLARALHIQGLSESDIRIENVSDAEIVSHFDKPSTQAIVTWKPQLAQILTTPESTLVFDSSRIPGEVIDLMVANTKVLRDNPAFGKALAGAWYETMNIMAAQDAKATRALNLMAKASGTDLEGFKSQLTSTKLFAAPAEAQGFTSGSNIIRTMDLVRTFSFKHGLLGKTAKTVDSIGIEFPRDKTLGDPRNIKLRFDTQYAKLAAENKL
jgi:NitT/TauT family transport system substrate-binding protein